MLDAGCPHRCIHRLEIRSGHNVLAVSGKDGRGLRRDLRRGIAVLTSVAASLRATITTTAGKPRIVKTQHWGTGIRSRRTCGCVRRVLLVALGGEPVRLIPGKLKPRAKYGLPVANRIEGDAHVRRP